MKPARLNQLVLLFTCIAIVSFSPAGKKRKKTAHKAVISSVKKIVTHDTTENPYYIIVDKSDYELKVFDKEGWYATYPIVFGSKDLSDKMKEGDKRTPEGNFKVVLKKIHPELM